MPRPRRWIRASRRSWPNASPIRTRRRIPPRPRTGRASPRSERVEAARAEVAALIGADAARDHLHLRRHRGQQPGAARRGARARARAGQAPRRTSSARAPSTSRCSTRCKQLEKEGFAVTLVEPDETGRVPPEAVATALRADTLLVSLMLANNEIGVVNDVAADRRAVPRRAACCVHTDASQAVGKLPVDVRALGVDFLSLTAHKFYGPKGIGALYVRESARPRIAPMQFGGGHERGLRSGTLPTHQIVGLGRGRRAGAHAGRGAMPRTRATSRRACGASSRPFPGVQLQRHRAAACPGPDQCLVRGRRRRKPDHRPAGDRGVHGLGLQLGDARAELRAARAGAQHRARAELAAAVAGAIHDGRGRRCGRHRHPRAKSRGCGRWRATVELGRATARPGVVAGDRDSLLARALNPLARRYFLAPARVPDSRRARRRPMCARAGPGGRPTAPRCCSN